MAHTIQPDPHEVRLQARLATYPNSATEQEILRAVDEAVFQGVRTYEQQIVESVREFLDDKQMHVDAGAEIVKALQEEIRYPLLDGATPNPALAARFERLKGLAQQAQRELVRAESEAAWLRERADDPYAAYISLMSKWPLVRPALVF